MEIVQDQNPYPWWLLVGIQNMCNYAVQHGRPKALLIFSPDKKHIIRWDQPKKLH